MEILYEDKWLVVCVKPAGVLSEEFGKGRCMPQMLKAKTGAYRIDVVHRLDKPAAGVMVFSKNPKATAGLSKQIAERKMQKEYFAIVEGVPEEREGTWNDYLFRDRTKNKSYVVKTLRRGAKDASLSYKVIKTIESESGVLSLLRISLHTGRTHQIRVQCASRKLPLYGDGKYGSANSGELALWSTRLCFSHPVSGKPMEFFLAPQQPKIWNGFKEYIEAQTNIC